MNDVPMASSGHVRNRDVVFWDVDTQRDFMLPGGALYVPGAERIIPNLARLTQHARRHDILVVADVDAHHSDDPEFQQWPPHCLAGTPGQEKVHETELNVGCVIPNVPAELPNDFSQYEQVIIEKQTLDVFDNPNIDELLKRIGKPEVVVYGVVTEICVSYAALGLLKRGYNIRLVTDAVRALDEKKAGAFMDQVERRGGKRVTTDDVVRPIA
jgi:nicotinamidase/pyrazinamidase